MGETARRRSHPASPPRHAHQEITIMANQNPHRVFVVRKLPRSIALLIEYLRAILAAMASNPHFPTPNPALSAVTASVNALESAHAATKTRALGSVPVRDVARQQTLDQVRLLLGYIQQVADASPDQAAAIIAGTGMAVTAST